MTLDQILANYKNELSPEAINSLKKQLGSSINDAGTVYVRSYVDLTANNGNVSVKCGPSKGILGGLEAHPVLP